MPAVNLQVRIAPELDHAIAELAPGARSAFVREAIVEKVARERRRIREQLWIDALSRVPESDADAEAWVAAEVWGTDEQG